MRRYFHRAPVTVALSALIVLVYLITAVQSRSLEQNWVDSSLANAWILFAPAMHDPIGLLRAVGSMFIHLGASHLAMNIFMLVILGPEIERRLGSGLFAGAYLASGLGGSLAVMMMDPLAPTAGASGALYGLMALVVGMSVRSRMDLRAALVLVGINLLYSLVARDVSLWGHVGGLLVGAVLSWPLVFVRRSKVKTLVLVLVLVGLAVGIWHSGYALQGA